MQTFFILLLMVFGVLVGVGIMNYLDERKKIAWMSPDQRGEYQRKKRITNQMQMERGLYGAMNPALVCPHCHTTGKVRTKQETQKVGISGGKATGAILTGGVSLLATGLSRKQNVTAAWCGNCRSVWHF